METTNTQTPVKQTTPAKPVKAVRDWAEFRRAYALRVKYNGRFNGKHGKVW